MYACCLIVHGKSSGRVRSASMEHMSDSSIMYLGTKKLSVADPVKLKTGIWRILDLFMNINSILVLVG